MSIRVPASRVDQIVKRKRSITADTALRLGQYFGQSAQFWMNLPSQYDLSVAVASIDQIRHEVVRRSAWCCERRYLVFCTAAHQVRDAARPVAIRSQQAGSGRTLRSVCCAKFGRATARKGECLGRMKQPSWGSGVARILASSASSLSMFSSFAGTAYTFTRRQISGSSNDWRK